MKKVDFLITTGGVSVGDFDFLPDIYNKLGAEVLFNKVAMRPGSVTTVARADDMLAVRPFRQSVRMLCRIHPVCQTDDSDVAFE
nr:molybdopterin-binding protein [Bacillus velezensis]